MSSPIVVISGPSGVGKTCLIEALLRHPRCRLSVSATTRPRRPNEVDGVHYHFMQRPDFHKLLANDALLEAAEVYGNLYGTPVTEVDPYVAAGMTVVLDVDAQGFRSIKARRPGITGIFVMPPSLEELERRLRARGTESEESLARRLAFARAEMGARNEYDHVVVNDDLARVIRETESILGLPADAPAQGERAKRDEQ